MWMNEWEVQDAQGWFAGSETPNLHKGAQALRRLMHWTNGCSDGWAYWQIPARSAGRLMEKLQEQHTAYRHYGKEVKDLTAMELAGLLRPVRAMLRKQGVEETDSVLFPPAPPPPPPPPVERWVYLPGDLTGPDLLGIVYEDEEPAIENASENDGVAWKIKALLIPDSAVKVWEKEEDDD